MQTEQKVMILALAFNYWGIFQTLWTLQKLGPGLDCGPVLITNFLKTATHNRQLGWKMNDVLAFKLPFLQNFGENLRQHELLCGNNMNLMWNIF